MKTRCKIVLGLGFAAIIGTFYSFRKAAKRLIFSNLNISFRDINLSVKDTVIPFNITGTNHLDVSVTVEKFIGELYYKNSDIGNVDLNNKITIESGSRFKIPVTLKVENIIAATRLGKDLIAGKGIEKAIELRGYLYYNGGEKIRYSKRLSA